MDLQEEIKSLKAHIALLEKQIADEKKQEEPKFERTIGKTYYYIDFGGDAGTVAVKELDSGTKYSGNMFIQNNYFHTRERAEEVAEKLKVLLKLERLHDTFCPDYVPDFTDGFEKKYHVFRNWDNTWFTAYYNASQDAINVYFSTEEIAQKVCDILNSEKEAE